MSTADGPPRARSRRVDPLTVVVGVAALVTYLLHGFGGFLSRDLGIYTYAGQQVLDGVPPYAQILNRAGPLAHLLPALGIGLGRLVGLDDLTGARLLFLLLAVACVVLTYLVARDLFSSPSAGLAAAAAFLTFGGFIEYASNGPREKTPMVLFLLLTLWVLPRKRWLLAGVFVSLATLTLQIAFFVAMPAILVALLGARRGERLRGLVQVLVGGAAPVVVFVVYFAVVGALGDAAEAFVLINARYTIANPAFAHPGRAWASLVDGYGVSLWVLVVGMLALWASTVLALLDRRARSSVAGRSVVAVGVASVVGLYWTTHDFDGWADVFPLLPLAAIGIGGVVDRLARRSADAANSLTLAWTLACLILAVTFSLTTRDHRLALQQGSTAAVLGQLPGDATVLSVQAPEALVLAGKTNPTRYQMFSGGLSAYMNASYPGGLGGFGRSVRRQGPDLIATGRVRPGWIAGTLAKDYEMIGHAPGWVWYASRALGPHRLNALHAAQVRWRASLTPDQTSTAGSDRAVGAVPRRCRRSSRAST